MTDKRIRIILDPTQPKKAAKDIDNEVKKIGKSANNSAFSMNKLAAAIAGVISIQKLTQYADAWTKVQNQLKQTTTTQEGLNRATEEMVRIALSTRTSLEETTNLYSRFRLSISESELSTERLVGVIETINKSLAISGATAQESAGALRQLSQAIASGVLRGEEFNSIAEQAPAILAAVSAATGKNAGELRKLAAEGALTSKVLIDSLEAYGDTVDRQFAKATPTIQQGFEVLRTGAIVAVGEIDKAIGASSSFAQTLVNIGNKISSAEFISGFIENFDIARLTIDSVTNSLNQFANEVDLAGDIGSRALDLFGESLKNLFPNLKTLVQVLTVEVFSTFDKLRISATTLFSVLSKPFDSDNLKTATEKYLQEIEAINQARQDSIQNIFDEREAIISTAEAQADARKKEIEARKSANFDVAPNATTSGTPFIDLSGGKPPKQTKEQKATNAFEDEITAAQSVTNNLKMELETRLKVAQFYRDANLKGTEESFEREKALLNAREQEQLALIEQRAGEDTQRREDQLRKALEHENLLEEQVKLLKEEYRLQELEATAVYEAQKTAIQEDAIRQREQLDKLEYQARLNSFANLGNALLQLGQGQSRKVFETGKALALAQAAVALPGAVIESFKNGGGYPWGLVPAAAMLATGLKNIQQIKSAKFGSSSGAGASVGGGATGGGGQSLPTTNGSQETFQQRTVIEIRGIDKDSLITGEQLTNILQRDDNVIVALNGAQADAQRRGVI